MKVGGILREGANMLSLDTVMQTRKPTIWKKFLELAKRAVPEVPKDSGLDPQQAMTLGYRLGLKTGYGEGLVDGVGLGMEAKNFYDGMPVMTFPEPFDIN